MSSFADPVRVVRGWQLLELGRPDAALTEAFGRLSTDPRDVGALCLASAALLAKSEPTAALEHAREAISAAATNEPAPWLHYAAALQVLERWDDAESAARDALRADPHLWACHASLARSLAHLEGRVDEAVDAGRDAVARGPFEPGAHVELARALLAAGDPGSAEEMALAALRLDPHCADAVVTLAQVDVHEKRFGGAAGTLLDAARLDPHRRELAEVVDSLLRQVLLRIFLALFNGGLVASWSLGFEGAAARVVAYLAITATMTYTTWVAARFVWQSPRRVWVHLGRLLRRDALLAAWLLLTVLAVIALATVVPLPAARHAASAELAHARVWAILATPFMVLCLVREDRRLKKLGLP